MTAILDLSRAFDVYTIALMLSVPRIFAFLQASQLLNSSVVPGTTRTGVILVLGMVVVPANLDLAASFDRSLTSYVFLFGKETLVGYLLGYIVAWIFWVVGTAGALIDNQRGAGIASSIDPLQGHDSSPLGNMVSLTFQTYIFSTGSVLTIFSLLYHSYVAWPVGSALPTTISADFPKFVLNLFDQSMRLGFELAAPVVAVMFTAEFALAMVSRFAPQIQVFVLAMPIKSLLGLIVMIFYVQTLFPYVDKRVGDVPALGEIIFSTLRASQPHVPQQPPGPLESPR